MYILEKRPDLADELAWLLKEMSQKVAEAICLTLNRLRSQSILK